MGRRGPAPKPDSERIRRNKVISPLRIVEGMQKVPAPALPAEAKHWPQRTKEWWKMWTTSPLLADSTAEDWSELLDTALLHAFVWDPDNHGTPAWFNAMRQLRQRTANYGATPLDRQRLRIQFTFAEEAEDKAETRRATERASSARQRRGALKEAN